MSALLIILSFWTAHAQDEVSVGAADPHAGPGVGAPEPEVPQIINGAVPDADAWPAAGGLLADATVMAFGRPFDVLIFMCSSTLIAPDVVLTAGHCVDTEFLEAQGGGLFTIEDLRFVWSPQADLSMYGIGGPTDLPEIAATSAVWADHPEFVGAANIAVNLAENHDIALIFLDEPVTDRPFAYLPRPDEVDQLVEGEPVVIVGWGNQEPVRPGSQPRPGKVGIKMAADSVIGPVGPTEFQVGPETEQGRTCQGDSGGPTFQQVQTEALVDWRVIGVTSHAWDTSLCERTGGVHTRVSAYLEWIDAEMRARCADGTRVWCEEPGIPAPPYPVDDEDAAESARACGCASAPTPVGALAWAVGLAIISLGRRSGARAAR